MEEDSKSQGGLKWVLAAGGLGVSTPFFFLSKDIAMLIALIIVGLLIVLVGGYFLWTFWRKKRAREGFRGPIDGPGGAIPGVDAKGLAELDAMRRKFQEGIQAYKSRGKDLYSLPWYLLVGESSAGKTEAVRHCGVGFPPGLTDQLQGVGGTINMHWWFTNQAVILDTAGKMLFSGIKPGESSLWQDFLKHLKKSRPHCPINGLVLVLPVNSLIKDSANKIGEKAAVIAKQIDLIQRTLDVRFPVFLLVTKCDLLTGFREYFDGMEDIEAMQQIFGWSNPEPLDALFQPELVDQHLEVVAQRLRRRRLAMLRDPAERGPGKATRLEAVDSLFALPQSLLLIAPRLKRYLQTIFVAGEWAPKPVFLRGIYFSSSLQQGSPLDEALATLRGVSIEDMREEIEGAQTGKTFFLYDLFTEKIFKERGLVTRATNTLSMLRRRRWGLLGTGAAILLGWAGISFYGVSKLKQSVGLEAEDWQRAETNWVEGAWANPIVAQSSPGKPYVFKGDEPMGSGSATWTDYYVRLNEKAENPAPVPWMFKPLAVASGGVDRKPARNVVFAHAVLKPLLQSTRSAMSERVGAPDRDANVVDRHNQALTNLIDVERDRAGRGSLRDQPLRTNAAARHLKAMVSYLTATNAPQSISNLAPVFATIYTQRKGEVPGWDSGGSSLKENAAIGSGLDQFFNNSNSRLAELESQKLRLEKIREAARTFRTNEESLHRSGLGDSLEWANLTNAQKALSGALAAATNSGLILESDRLLHTNYMMLTNNAGILALNASVLVGKLAQVGEAGIFQEIKKRAEDARGVMVEPYIKSYRDSTDDMSLLDATILGLSGTNYQYAVRAMLYELAVEFGQTELLVSPTIGEEWVTFKNLQARTDDIKRQATNYAGPYSNELRSTCSRLLTAAENRLREEWGEGYLRTAGESLKGCGAASGMVDFQLLSRSNTFFAIWERDLAGIPLALQPKLKPLLVEITNARARLVEKLAMNLNEDLRQQVGFPVIWDSPNLLDWKGVVTLKRYCKDLSGKITELKEGGKYPMTSFGSLSNSLTKLLPVLTLLAGNEDKSPKVAVKIIPQVNLDSKLGLTHEYPEVRVLFGGRQRGYTYVGNSGIKNQVEVGSGELEEQSISIQMKETGNDQVVPPPQSITNAISNGVIGWLQKEAKSEEGILRSFDAQSGTWTLRVKMRDAAGKPEFVELMVSIGGASWPSPEKWPRIADLK